MSANDGHKNEYEIITLLHNQTIDQLPKHFYSWITQLLPTERGKLVAKKLNNEQKADISLKIGKTTKYISIKSGESNSFRSEPIQTFIPFLRSLGVSDKRLKTIVLFHYGDNTYDGTGPVRYTSAELRKVPSLQSRQASQELSDDKIVNAVIERCITKGRFLDNYVVDGIYHGTIQHGVFISSRVINNILLRKSNRRKNGTINISMLTYQPGCCNLWGIPGSEQKRGQSEIKWRSFTQDIKEYI